MEQVNRVASSVAGHEENLFGFKPGGNRVRESLNLIGWLVFVFGGPLLSLRALRTYPFPVSYTHLTLPTICSV